jgi:RNA polymerase sigma factor (sigma-70 family)
MNEGSLEDLLELLNLGDPAAAEATFIAYEPYLRQVVRRLLPARLRAKFDSLDIVLSTWGDLWQGFQRAGWRFADAQHLRAFLVRATRNRFIDRYRQLNQVAQREQSLDGMASAPADGNASHPENRLMAQETWHHLLALCPAQHRAILRLRRAGLPLEQIAARTGMHPASIRRILRRLASAFAAEALAETGARAEPVSIRP